MTPAKMFEGDLWVLASDAVQMAQNAYKNGQADEREACAKVCEEDAFVEQWKGLAEAVKRIRARGQA
jgi:hypothetical protein